MPCSVISCPGSSPHELFSSQRRDGRSVYFKSNAYNNATGALLPERSLFGLRFKDDRACSDFVGAHESSVVALQRAAAGVSNAAPVPRPQRELQTLQEDTEAELSSPSNTYARGKSHAGPVSAPEGLDSSPVSKVVEADSTFSAGPSTAEA
jgi:hypothetical protein